MNNFVLGIIFVACLLALGFTHDEREQPDGTVKEVGQ